MGQSPKTLAQELAAALARRGVRHAFGMPGGVLLHLLDAFRDEGIEFVLVRHEGSAGFMADAAAQLTGAPGVCVGTLGPGVTNLVSPIAGAHLERTPVVAITGQIQTELLGRYTHQILDHVALFEPITRHAVLLSKNDPRAQIQTALAAMESGVPGPVLIDVPAELWNVPIGDVHTVAPTLPAVPDLGGAVGRMSAARRPVIAVGELGLTDRVADAVTLLSERLSAPVITTYRAKGAIDEDHPLSAGAFGLSPVVDRHQQRLLGRSDLLIAVGVDPVELRPQWLPGWPSDLPMISIGSSADIVHPVAEDLGENVVGALEGLLAAVLESPSEWTHGEVADHNQAWMAPFEDGPTGPATYIRAVRDHMGPDSICSMDVGAHRITASHAWRCSRPWQQLQSNGFSSMGTGLPGAIAAKLSHPERPVVALTGDMGLWMALGELGIVQERNLDLAVVYFADRSLSLIELKQERIPLPLNGVRFEDPDPTALALAFGGTGHRVNGLDDLAEAFDAFHQTGGLHLIEIELDPSPYRQQM